eukprot:gene21653-1233_t
MMATDASTEGWGAVLFDELTGDLLQAGSRWERRRSCHEINELEAEAVWKGLQAFDLNKEKIEAGGLLILVDNTSVKFTISKGRAREWPLNYHVNKVLKELQGAGRVAINYINTL